MFIITDVKIIEVKDYGKLQYTLMHFKPGKNPLINGENGIHELSEEHIQEVIQGRIYVNDRGQRYIIAAPKQVQDTLSLMMDVSDSTFNRLIDAEQKLHHHRLFQVEVKTASLWKRIKYMFTGTF